MTGPAVGPVWGGVPARRAPHTGCSRPAREAGQASLELLMLLPILVTVAVAVLALLAGHAAREGADQAAVAAAVAQLQGRDAKAAAQAASPGWSHSRVVLAGGRATVTIAPRLPDAVAALIDAQRTVVFDAGDRQATP